MSGRTTSLSVVTARPRGRAKPRVVDPGQDVVEAWRSVGAVVEAVHRRVVFGAQTTRKLAAQVERGTGCEAPVRYGEIWCEGLADFEATGKDCGHQRLVREQVDHLPSAKEGPDIVELSADAWPSVRAFLSGGGASEVVDAQ